MDVLSLTWQKYLLKRKASLVRHMATAKMRGPWGWGWLRGVMVMMMMMMMMI